MCNSGDEPNENADCDGSECEEERVCFMRFLLAFICFSPPVMYDCVAQIALCDVGTCV